MQTKQQIQQLLASAGVQPNKRWGQNFLIDLNLMRLLIDRANIQASDIVLEVGTGTGSFTEGLAEQAGHVVSVEIDPVLAKIATAQLAKAGNVTIVNTDALEGKHKISSEVVSKIETAQTENFGRLLLVANLPYGAASPLMMNLVEGPLVADGFCVTVQKEVAERMAAESGGKDYGSLSICLHATGSVRIERILKPGVFWPAPQVESAMVIYNREKKKAVRIHDFTIFGEVVSLFMGHRRKMLKACAKFADGQLASIHSHTWSQIFEESCTDPHLRPEQIAPENYIAMANLCAENLS